NRAEPVYAVDATLLAPARTLSVDLPNDVPTPSGPILPDAYGAVLRSADLLVDAWRRLNPNDTSEPSVSEVEALRNSLSFRSSERPRSTLIMIEAEGGSPAIAMGRANAVTEALIDWDDSRARAEAAEMVIQLESRLAALEEQL